MHNKSASLKLDADFCVIEILYKDGVLLSQKEKDDISYDVNTLKQKERTIKIPLSSKPMRKNVSMMNISSNNRLPRYQYNHFHFSFIFKYNFYI